MQAGALSWQFWALLSALFAALIDGLFVARAVRLAAIWFAVGAAIGLLAGRVPFDLGLAIGLGALVAARFATYRPGRQALALLLAVMCALASPVAGAFLALAALSWALGGPSKRFPLLLMVAALAPIALLFAAFWWTFVDSPRARRIAAVVLFLNVAYHAGLAWAQGPELSLYKNREVVAAAVRLKEPEMFAHRRDFAIDGGPAVLSDLSRSYDPTRDFEVVESTLRPGPWSSLHWTVTVRNRSAAVAFRDPLYQHAADIASSPRD